MSKIYIYNKNTHVLHIEGCCTHAKRTSAKLPHIIYFNSEDEALAYDGRSVGLCKICQKKRENLENTK